MSPPTFRYIYIFRDTPVVAGTISQSINLYLYSRDYFARLRKMKKFTHSGFTLAGLRHGVFRLKK